MGIDLFVTLLSAWPSGLIDLLSAILGARVKLKADDAPPSRGLQEVDLSVLAPAAEAAIKVSFYLRGVPETQSTNLHQINRQLRTDGVMAVEVENYRVRDAGTKSVGMLVRHRASGQPLKAGKTVQCVAPRRLFASALPKKCLDTKPTLLATCDRVADRRFALWFPHEIALTPDLGAVAARVVRCC